MGVMAPLFEDFFFSENHAAYDDKFYEVGHFFQPPLKFFRKSQKTEFGKKQKRQKCHFGHFLTSDVGLILDVFCRNFKFDLSL